MTIRRLLELHACPVLYMRVSHASCAEALTSFVSSTIYGSEPPSSSTDFFRFLLACAPMVAPARSEPVREDRKSTRLNSSHVSISYAVFCLKKKIDIFDNVSIFIPNLNLYMTL